MWDYRAPLLKATRVLAQGLVTVALLVPNCNPETLARPVAAPPKGQFAGCGTLDGSLEEANCLQLVFQGEVSDGQTFEQAIGGNLLFRLNPVGSHGSGWTIEVIPRDAEDPEHSEYAWVVTPPYHFGNQRYLDTSYGVSAKEAVHNTPREFNFVLNEDQFKKAYDLVELAISSHPESDHRSQAELEKESNEAIAALMKLPVSTGQLLILDSKTTEPSEPKDLGSIKWIKFKVILRVPCDFAAAKGTREFSVDGSSCDNTPGKKNS